MKPAMRPEVEKIDQFFDVIGVFHAGVGIIVAPDAAVGVGSERVVHAEGLRDVVFPRSVSGDAHGGVVAAVVGVAQGDDVKIARVGTRHENGEVVGFGARVDKVAGL